MSFEEVVLQNDQDQKSWQWLLARFSELQLQTAIDQIPGQRKKYVSNIAKELGVTIPESALYLSKSEVKEKMREIRAILRL